MHPISAAALVAGALMVSVVNPAAGETVTWLAGPLSLNAGKVGQVTVSNPDIFPCRVGVRVSAGPASRLVAGTSTVRTTLLVNTFQDPDIMPAGGMVVVGIGDPNIMPGQRRLVTAQIRTSCDGIAAADIRARLVGTLQIGDPDNASTTAVVAARSQ